MSVNKIFCKSLLVNKTKTKDDISVCVSRNQTTKGRECGEEQFTCGYTYSYGNEVENVELDCQCTNAPNNVRVCPLPTDSEEIEEGKKAL